MASLKPGAGTFTRLPPGGDMWDFPKNRGVPYFGVLIIGILLFRVLYWGPLFSQTPMWALKPRTSDIGFGAEVGLGFG